MQCAAVAWLRFFSFHFILRPHALPALERCEFKPPLVIYSLLTNYSTNEILVECCVAPHHLVFISSNLHVCTSPNTSPNTSVRIFIASGATYSSRTHPHPRLFFRFGFECSLPVPSLLLRSYSSSSSCFASSILLSDFLFFLLASAANTHTRLDTRQSTVVR